MWKRFLLGNDSGHRNPEEGQPDEWCCGGWTQGQRQHSKKEQVNASCLNRRVGCQSLDASINLTTTVYSRLEREICRWGLWRQN